VRGLDTNILVRFFIQDDPEQTQTVLKLFEQTEEEGGRLHVTAVALCELVWVLGSVYKQTRNQILAALESLLDIELLEVQDRDLVQRALTDCRTGPAEFSDYLIGWQSHQTGCIDTLTFDRGLRNAPRFTHLR
jgi:predicted nucleic-acid-binding protein